MSSQGGKLEIAGTVVGQWAGARRSRGRGGFPVQVVSVGGPNRGWAHKEDKISPMCFINFFYLFVNHVALFLSSVVVPEV